jgi:regulator of replication initiation timing
MHKNVALKLALVGALCLTIIGCEDTKAHQENDQLKARVAELVKENGNLGNNVDALTQENTALKHENEQLKARTSKSKKSSKKHHRHSSATQ